MPEFTADRIQANNWVQGIVVERNSITFPLVDLQNCTWESECDFLVLFTQDCDLLNPSIKKEPFAEFFCAISIPRILSPNAYGKNPRIIHLETKKGRTIEIQINHRIRVDRSLLATQSISPDNDGLHGLGLSLVLTWFSKKYVRPAFPDAFNRILKSIRKLDTSLQEFDARHPEVKRIFLHLNPENEELPEASPYVLDIILLILGFSPDDEDEENRESIRSSFLEFFRHERLSIGSCECLYENEMTVYDLGLFKVWDKDYLTLGRKDT